MWDRKIFTKMLSSETHQPWEKLWDVGSVIVLFNNVYPIAHFIVSLTNYVELGLASFHEPPLHLDHIVLVCS